MSEKIDPIRERRRKTTEETVKGERSKAGDTQKPAGGKTEKGPTKIYHRAVPAPEQREACLVLISGGELGRRYNLRTEDPISFGRGEENEVILEQEEVSRTHCKVRWYGVGYMLTDLDSTNGTYVNDQPVLEAMMRDGDQVQIAGLVFKFISSANIEIAYHEEIYRLSTTDGLTKAYNKRYLMDSLAREVSRCRRQQSKLSLIMLDIDHFKQVNDIHGHIAGDQVLRQMAGIIRTHIRQEDLLARFGGEEFMVVLPEVDAAGALHCAEKIHALVQDHAFEFEGVPIQLTASLGVASFGNGVDTAEELLLQVDERLYQAKSDGRNLVCGPP